MSKIPSIPFSVFVGGSGLSPGFWLIDEQPKPPTNATNAIIKRNCFMPATLRLTDSGVNAVGGRRGGIERAGRALDDPDFEELWRAGEKK